MANNRMVLVCMECGSRVRLAKYYPSTGWYSGTGHSIILDKFFDAHRHGDHSEEGPTHIRMRYMSEGAYLGHSG